MTIGRDIDLEGPAGRVKGHWVEPSGSAGAPGLLLIPDVHGVSDLYRDLAGRFAEAGFVTLVLDLYAREGAPKLAGVAEAMAFIAGLSDARILGDVRAGIEQLASAGGAQRRVAIAGWCMGGQVALLSACELRGLSACVSFYGMVRYAERTERKPRSPLDAAAELGCPYLGIFGAEDPLIPIEDIDDLQAELEGAGKTFEIHRYPGCGHAFMNAGRADAYRPEAAADAFARARQFLITQLGPSR